MSKYLTGLFLTALLASPALAQAQQAPWYRVDLMIFTQPGNPLNDENWDTTLSPQLSGNHINLHQPPQGLVKGVSNAINLPANRSGMRSQGYEILFTRSWQQKMLSRNQTKPIRIQAGERLDGTYTQLDGEISLDIARYLHLRTNLYYSIPVSADWLNSHTPRGVQDSASSGQPSMDEPGGTTSEAPTVIAAAPTRSANTPGILTVKMEQGRRMRGDELHYLDHPYFGLLIKMTRLQNQPVAPLPEEVKTEPAAKSITDAQLATVKNAVDKN